MEIKDSFSEVFNDIKKVLVVLAHPDDMEIVCGGIVARLTSNKIQVRLVVTTNGGKGMKDKEGLNESEFAKSRISEQVNAGKILGIPEKQNFNLEIPDGEFETSVENIGKIAFHIRQFKPNLVITHNPTSNIISFFNKSHWVNHRDHRNTGQVTLDACYPYARDTGFFVEQLKNGLNPHSVTKVLLADSYTSESVKYFQIDEFLDKKKNALQQHITAFDPADADDYIEENKIEDGYYEPLGFYKIY
jgi:LmbE family N-acetylglucosaminyl deacetylase